MTTADAARWATPLRIREVPPADEWFGTPKSSRHSSLFSNELALRDQERAQVLYFDLARLDRWERVAAPVASWARRYREAFPAEAVPATLVAVGRKLPAVDRQLLLETDVYFLNEGRGSIRRLMGDGDRGEQIKRLIQRLSGTVILSPVPVGIPTGVAGYGASQPPDASDWDVYTQRPQHIDRSDVDALFKKLSRPPEDWERDD